MNGLRGDKGKKNIWSVIFKENTTLADSYEMIKLLIIC